MSEPFTISGGLLTIAGHVFYHVLGGGVHERFEQFLERWRESGIGLPHNHDLNERLLTGCRVQLPASRRDLSAL